MTGRKRAKANAFALRANGLAIREVAERVGMPVSTVGDWLRGRGETYGTGECKLCGERFIASNGRQIFCTPAHQQKYRRIYGPPQTIDAARDRIRVLEAEVAQLRERLSGREAA